MKKLEIVAIQCPRCKKLIPVCDSGKLQKHTPCNPNGDLTLIATAELESEEIVLSYGL